MPHIELFNSLPGIRGLVQYRPEMGQPLYTLAQTLLRGPSPLSEADRELIATHVSHLNQCVFCTQSHAAAARCLMPPQDNTVDAVLDNPETAPVSAKMKALLHLAGKVQQLGKAVLPEDIQYAKSTGATDMEIHDAVLVAAAFCLYNRYVDGLASLTPQEPEAYQAMGKRMAEMGYVMPTAPNP